MSHLNRITPVLFILLCVLLSTAETYRVGKGMTYAQLDEVTERCSPGDTVLVEGNATYEAGAQFSRSGTVQQWITILGVQPEGGTRPELSGSAMYGIEISGDYIVCEGFEVVGSRKGIGVFGDNIIVRNCVINSCNHGLIGYGTGTGNVTVEYCEFYGNGVSTGGATQHQIYMATDEEAHPGAVFRLQFCYLHDGQEGDNVKSRAERNEIYYNWIERAGSSGHGLGLFAPDPEDNEAVDIATAREDADVVGNVIIQHKNACARIGGDAPGYPTNGRYRFVNNTFILIGTRGDVIRTFNTVETVEMYNNVIYGTQQGADIRVINDADGEWVHSPRSLTGSNNWVIQGASRLPVESEWSGTLTGSVLPFIDVEDKNYTPSANSPLRDAGIATTPTITSAPFSEPLFPPAWHPPLAQLPAPGTAVPRPKDAAIDIGAFEGGASAVIPHLRIPGRMGAELHRLNGTGIRKCIGLNGKSLHGMQRGGTGVYLITDGSDTRKPPRKVIPIGR